MGHHIDDDGRFQSDKHPELPPDRIRLSFEREASQRALWVLSEDYASIDPGLAEDIQSRLLSLGYRPTILGKLTTLSPRPEWKMPEPPSPECKPWAYLVGSNDGWDLYWATPEQADEGEPWDKSDASFISWPFGLRDVAKMEDFVALGFNEAG